MDSTLRSYLRERNKLAYLAITPPIIIIFTCLCLSRYLLLLSGWSSLWLPTIIVTSAIPILFFFSCFLRYISEPDIDQIIPLDPHDFSRMTSLVKPIVDQCRLKKTLYLIYHPNYQNLMGADSNATASYILISDQILTYQNFVIQAVLAHEIGHVLAGDSLKSILINTLHIAMIAFLLLTALIAAPLLSPPYFMIMTGLIYPTYLLCKYISSKPRRVMEDTADGIATLMGYGEGLKTFFILTPDNKPKVIKAFEKHGHHTTRIENINRIQRG